MMKCQSVLFSLLALCLSLLTGCTSLQRGAVFHPSHRAGDNGLQAWTTQGRTIGYCRPVAAAETVWLMLHGNAGQASSRAYALHCFSDRDAVFILEYPGYGARAGKPSRATFDAAAREGFALLRRTFPNTPICVVGESLGTGPASALASQTPPPDKIVLLVPFDKLTSVAAERFRGLPVGWLMEARWNNIRALANYRGPVDIYGAANDTVIPIAHARKLAESVRGARFEILPGAHGDWPRGGRVRLRYP
jgi:uncharacterized protein